MDNKDQQKFAQQIIDGTAVPEHVNRHRLQLGPSAAQRAAQRKVPDSVREYWRRVPYQQRGEKNKSEEDIL